MKNLRLSILMASLVVLPALADDQAGMTVAKDSGCLACHAIDKKVVGPAWYDVAVRYKDNPEAKNLLINKIKTGGKGNWLDVTGGVPMPPYSPRVSDGNIETLVEFILSLSSRPDHQ